MGHDISTEDWIRMKDCVEKLDKNINGNGKEPLEMRIRKYVDQQDTDKQKNMEQSILDLRHENDLKHNQNTGKLDKISEKQDSFMRMAYIGLGIVITLESLGIFKK